MDALRMEPLAESETRFDVITSPKVIHNYCIYLSIYQSIIFLLELQGSLATRLPPVPSPSYLVNTPNQLIFTLFLSMSLAVFHVLPALASPAELSSLPKICAMHFHLDGHTV